MMTYVPDVDCMMETFWNSLTSGDRSSVRSVLTTIMRSSWKEGMRRAAEIAACHDLTNGEYDTVAREIARAILEEESGDA